MNTFFIDVCMSALGISIRIKTAEFQIEKKRKEDELKRKTEAFKVKVQ
jgi:hypothetical protein